MRANGEPPLAGDLDCLVAPDILLALRTGPSPVPEGRLEAALSGGERGKTILEGFAARVPGRAAATAAQVRMPRDSTGPPS